MKLLSILILLLSLALPAWGATLRVCATGCDYTTLQAAHDAASDGDVIDGQGETFTAVLSITTAGIDFQNFTINAAGLNAHGIITTVQADFSNVTVTGANENGGTYYDGIQVRGTSGTTLTNCSSTNNAGRGLVMWATGTGQGGLTVTGGNFNGNGEAGILVTGNVVGTKLSNISISNVTASSNIGAGIYILKCDTVTLSNNTTNLNGDASNGNEDYGIAINCSDNVTASSNTMTGTINGAGFAIYGDTSDADCGTASTLLFSKNIINGTSSGKSCIEHLAVGDAAVPSAIYRSNIVANCGRRGFELYKSGAGSPSQVTLYNNTISETAESGLANLGAIFPAILRNNIWHNCGGASNISVDYYYADSGVTHTNNLYYKSTGSVFAWNGTEYTTADVTTAEATAVATDPLLNAAYGLADNSPAVDSGAVLYPYASHPGDRYGRKIYGNGPDIGAVEYEDHTPGGWFFEFFMPTIMKLCASTNAACYTQP